MGNFLVGHGCPVLVFRMHEVPYHVVLSVGFEAALATLVDDVLVDGTHLGVGGISTAILRQGQPREKEVDWSKALIDS